MALVPLRLVQELLSLLQTSVTVSTGLGIAFHLAIQQIDLDYHVHSFLAGCAVGWVMLVAVYLIFTPCNLLSAVYNSSANAASFTLGLNISISIYRLFLHRLHKFPGPWGAQLTRFYLTVRIFRSLQYHLVLDGWHRRYGDFVRTGPREISVNRLSAVQAVHGPSSRCVKAAWYAHVSNDVSKVSLHMTRVPEVHRQRRRALDRGFSTKALMSYEPLVTAKASVLLAQIRLHMGQTGSIDATQWSAFFSFDVMGLIGFGKDFHQLESAVEHVAIQRLHDSLTVLGRLSPVPWTLGLLGSIPCLMGSYTEFIEYCWTQVEDRKKQWDSQPNHTPTDIVSWLLKAIDERDLSAPPGNQALHEDGRMVVVAGSDTVTSTLANALYYLTSHPAVYRKLQRQIDAITSSQHKEDHATPNAFQASEVSDIPYLDAIIQETMRLKPASASGQPRQTPPEGLQIDEVWVPGNVTITVPQHTIQRDERYFPRGNEFCPERWMDNSTGVTEAAFFPFGIGPLSCVGKRLAIIEMRIVLSSIARHFDLEFGLGENGHAFDCQVKDTVTLSVPPLQLAFRDREIEDH